MRWDWDERCIRAFDRLRMYLVRELVSLAHPDWKGEFHIEADASSAGVAAVLSQLDDTTGKLRPIQFFSSSLNPSQRNYSAGQLEAWALVAATRKWSVYLKGAGSIVLVTDHCPLKWLKEQNDPKHTYARWLMELQELPFRIEFRPGRENLVADYLSRSHFGQSGTLRTLKKNFFWPKMTRDVIKCCHDCIPCQRTKCKNSGREPLCAMSIGRDVPGEAVAMDVGTLPWSDNPEKGYRYVLLMVDLFTRYVELQPMRDQETDSILDAFKQGWVYRGHGMP